MKGTPGIIVHGGVDTEMKDSQAAGVIRAAEKGLDVLRKEGLALDAVQVAVQEMEDAEVFDAGSGSVLCYDGKPRMHAGLMEGKTQRAGTVILIENIKNPILAARLVMDRTDQVALGGEGATKFAHSLGLAPYNYIPTYRKKQFELFKEKLESGSQDDYFLDWRFYKKIKELGHEVPAAVGGDTVGAVALDQDGNVAAAASTGGMLLQPPGRVSDVGVIGSGFFADNETGAVAVTGVGEVSIRYGIARAICFEMRSLPPQNAIENVMNVIKKRDDVPLGAIAINSKGQTGVWYNTKGMAFKHISLI